MRRQDGEREEIDWRIVCYYEMEHLNGFIITLLPLPLLEGLALESNQSISVGSAHTHLSDSTFLGFYVLFVYTVFSRGLLFFLSFVSVPHLQAPINFFFFFLKILYHTKYVCFLKKLNIWLSGFEIAIITFPFLLDKCNDPCQSLINIVILGLSLLCVLSEFLKCVYYGEVSTSL